MISQTIAFLIADGYRNALSYPENWKESYLYLYQKYLRSKTKIANFWPTGRRNWSASKWMGALYQHDKGIIEAGECSAYDKNWISSSTR